MSSNDKNIKFISSITNNPSRIDLNSSNRYCPYIEDTPFINAYTYTDANTPFGTHSLACEYSPFTFRSYEAINQAANIVSQFNNNVPSITRSSNDENLNKTSVFLCSQISTNCNNGAEFCSAFNDNGEVGDYCRALSDDLADASKLDYCRKYNTEECACIRGSLYDNDYNIFYSAGLNQYSDYCWYNPCSLSNNVLRLSSSISGDCPTSCSMCEKTRTIAAQNAELLSSDAPKNIYCLGTNECPLDAGITTFNSFNNIIPSVKVDNNASTAVIITISFLLLILIGLSIYTFVLIYTKC